MFSLSEFSDFRLLDNDERKLFEQDLIFNTLYEFCSDKKTEILSDDLNFSSAYSFNNVTSNKTRDLTFNKGLLSMEDALVLSLPDSTYSHAEELITNIDVEEYWFDNSVPSKITHFQNFLVPWGVTEKSFQVSHNFPELALPIEFHVSINLDLYTNIEADLYPAVELTDLTDIEFETTTLTTNINIEWGRGKSRSSSVSLEVKMDDIVLALPLEYKRVYYDYIDTPIEYKKVIELDENINTEFNVIEIYKDNVLNTEFSAGWEQIENTSIEFVTFDSIIINMEFLCAAPFNTALNIEYLNSQDDYYGLNAEADLYPAVPSNYSTPIEFINIYLTEYTIDLETFVSVNYNSHLDIETNISPITRDLTTNIEFNNIVIENIETPIETNISPITKHELIPLETNISINLDEHFNLEYWRVYRIDPSVNLEFDPSHIEKDDDLNLEISTATPFDRFVNLEVNKTKESAFRLQSFLIPFGYKETYFSLLVKAQSFIETPIEFDTSVLYSPKLNLETFISVNLDAVVDLEYNVLEIFKDDPLNLEYNIKDIFKDNNVGIEYKKIIIEDLVNNLQTDITIDLDNILGIEYNIKDIFKDDVLNLEFLMAMEDIYVNNLEYKTEIHRDYFTDLEFHVKEIFKDNPLNLEFNTEIHRDFITVLEYAVTEVSQSLNFEFDILDLVYYIIKNGRNIVPWLYASGEGRFDSSIEKNWDKEDTSSTVISNAFIEQLQYKGLSIPEIVQFSDKALENFGTVLTNAPGLTKDITLSDSFLYFDCIDNINNEYLVLGKSKKEAQSNLLKAGENLIIWDGKEGTYNDLLKPQLVINNPDNIVYTMFYDQRDGKWISKYDNHDLYFKYIIEGVEQLIPYIILIKVQESINIIKE